MNETQMAPGYKRATTQPNAGWGTLCESCANRDRSNLEADDFPCTRMHLYFRAPRYRRANLVGPSLVRYTNGHATWEECTDFRPDSDLPDLSRTAEALERYDHLVVALEDDSSQKGNGLVMDAAREVGEAFGQDTRDRNDPQVCADLIRPGPRVPAPGAELSFVRRMVQKWREDEAARQVDRQ